MDNILELELVSKTFPKSNYKLDKVSFSIPYGAIMGFVGENGAGKTTTIGCILNTVAKDSGTIKLFGKEMSDDDTDIREKIGVVYDGENFPGYLNAEELAKIMQGLYKNWDNELFQKYLRDFNLSAKHQELFQRNDDEISNFRCLISPPTITDFRRSHQRIRPDYAR